MVYKRFGFQLILRVGLLLCSLCLLAYLIVETNLYLSRGLLVLVVVGQVAEMVQYLRKANQQMTRFLSALVHNDFSYRPVSHQEGASWRELYQACDIIMQKMDQLRTASEEKHLFLQILTEQAGVGLITFNPAGEVALYNAEAKRLTGIPHLRHIQALNRLGEGLGDKLLGLAPGDRCLVKLVRDNSILQLAVRATHFRNREDRFTLLSLQHIGAELDEQEFLAWQKLISVLTHEVMNSITPIISLAGTARMLMERHSDSGEAGDEEETADLRSALETIESRSRGMLSFVTAYRKLNKVPIPEFRELEVQSLFRRLEQLERAGLAEKGIQLDYEVYPDNLRLYADPDLLEQVLLNLIINAADAFPKDWPERRINLKAWSDGGWKVYLSVTDTGPGIAAGLRDRIFIPFFSTKPHGSGIGLSICKQIMRAHGGDIVLNPEKTGETSFLMYLKAGGE